MTKLYHTPGDKPDDTDDTSGSIDVEAAAARAEGRDPNADDGDEGLVSRAKRKVKRALDSAAEGDAGDRSREESLDTQPRRRPRDDLEDLFGGRRTPGAAVGGPVREDDPFASAGVDDDELPFGGGADDDLDDLFGGGEDDDEEVLF